MRTSPPTVSLTLDQLASHAASLIADDSRYILGIAGAPGAGKSTASQAISQKLDSRCTVVEMDGFHLANRELDRLGRREQKGAPETFDADGYAALLHRLRSQIPLCTRPSSIARSTNQSAAQPLSSLEHR